jgi:UDP-GlcNAc3NAcA epimerase
VKVITVVGARPQFIKAALVSKEFKRQGIEEIIVHTGQHYDENMSDIFFNQMGIPTPKYNLNIRAKTHASMTGRMMEGIEEVLLKEAPDALVVYGDTNSTLAASLAARKLNISIAHIEAGLRNFDFTVPEDVNRVLTDRISDILFCPTDTAINNLLKEGFDSFPCKLIRTGDLMADSVSVFSKILEDEKDLIKEELRKLPKDGILVTIHRQETTKSDIIVDVVAFLNTLCADYPIVFPIHPRTKQVINKLGLKLDKSIYLLDPVGYLEMQYLLKSCQHVITDSGGLQKEAYLHRKKSLLLMDFTPWVELIDNECSITTELNLKDMLRNFGSSLKLKANFDSNLYGSGNAREQIVEEIRKLENDEL